MQRSDRNRPGTVRDRRPFFCFLVSLSSIMPATVAAVTSKDIQKARQNAKRNRTSVACSRCKLAKSKCSDYRPCKACTTSKSDCLESARGLCVSSRSQLHYKKTRIEPCYSCEEEIIEERHEFDAGDSSQKKMFPLQQHSLTGPVNAEMPSRLGAVRNIIENRDFDRSTRLLSTRVGGHSIPDSLVGLSSLQNPNVYQLPSDLLPALRVNALDTMPSPTQRNVVTSTPILPGISMLLSGADAGFQRRPAVLLNASWTLNHAPLIQGLISQEIAALLGYP
jgi:hypothetical protein